MSRLSHKTQAVSFYLPVSTSVSVKDTLQSFFLHTHNAPHSSCHSLVNLLILTLIHSMRVHMQSHRKTGLSLLNHTQNPTSPRFCLLTTARKILTKLYNLFLIPDRDLKGLVSSLETSGLIFLPFFCFSFVYYRPKIPY